MSGDSQLFTVLHENGMADFSDSLEKKLQYLNKHIKHGDIGRWKDAVESMPDLTPSEIILDTDTIRIGKNSDCDDENRHLIKTQLQQLMPWRKGPFEIFGVYVDAEWQSNLKWGRIVKSGISVKDHLVLDVGAGNGYYALRMLGKQARFVLGIDPTLLFIMQFMALRKYIPDIPAEILPMGIQDLPSCNARFDTVFSMGVIYHRKDPIQHLCSLYSFLKPGGQLVLESLVVENMAFLEPVNRYAKMSNVWIIPSPETLVGWIKQAGFIKEEILDVTVTTLLEQRKTEWMHFESLSDFLEPGDSNKTVEGYPAPKRALIRAFKSNR